MGREIGKSAQSALSQAKPPEDLKYFKGILNSFESFGSH